jgi:hypothetical protein
MAFATPVKEDLRSLPLDLVRALREDARDAIATPPDEGHPAHLPVLPKGIAEPRYPEDFNVGINTDPNRLEPMTDVMSKYMSDAIQRHDGRHPTGLLFNVDFGLPYIYGEFYHKRDQGLAKMADKSGTLIPRKGVQMFQAEVLAGKVRNLAMMLGRQQGYRVVLNGIQREMVVATLPIAKVLKNDEYKAKIKATRPAAAQR